MGKIRGANSSPGIYTQITDLQYAADSLGITTLGLVGETLQGPAFEPIAISNWEQFQNYFGGTSTELYSGSKYPKYELPYIAKSYLSVSDQLYVCRVLGLSGYDAGPAFIVQQDDKVVAILRSKGEFTDGEYDCKNSGGTNSDFNFYVTNVNATTTSSTTYNYECGNIVTGETTATTESTTEFKLTIVKKDKPNEDVIVSIKPGSRNYILDVLGTDPKSGRYSVYVESFYEGAIDAVSSSITATTQDRSNICSYGGVVDGAIDKISGITKPGAYLLSAQNTIYVDKTNNTIKFESGNTLTQETLSVGIIVDITVNDKELKLGKKRNLEKTEFVKNLSDGKLYYYDGANVVEYIVPVNDYKEGFRSAVTPWFVSQIRGEGNLLSRLFRFYTISDGDAANDQIKISIANINPENGTFDVLVRDFYDSDTNQVVLESFKNLTMMPGTSNYIGLKIGTINGDYPIKSKYIMAEIIEDENSQSCVPCGFLGYPYLQFSGATSGYTNPDIFATTMKTDVKISKQYFGLRDDVDYDYFKYKGRGAYLEDGLMLFNMTPGFHLDGRLSTEYSKNGVAIVDGRSGITFNCVDSTGHIKPFIVDNIEEDSIYHDIKARKFTCYPYGGFDGWNVFSDDRTNGNGYKLSDYKKDFYKNVGEYDYLTLPPRSNSSDYYAYLAGVMQFSNPDRYTINLLATPGIDIINNSKLVEEVIDMVEERKDLFYVVTTPDRAKNSTDSAADISTPDDVVSRVDDTYIDTYYASTYYPWVRYFDKTYSKFINLPVTKDVVRNMADVDNKKYPWYAPAGIERGKVECNRARIFTKLADENALYDGRINPVKTFSADGVKIWGNKTLYNGDTPMNRINTVRLVLYMRKLIKEASMSLIFEPNDTTLKQQFEGIIEPILAQIKSDRGITDYRLKVSQTPEQMDEHEISAQIHIKPTPTLEYIEIDFVVTPQGVEWDE